MRYLIVFPNTPPFFTEYFDPELHFADGATVIDVAMQLYFDGKNWVQIKIDQL